MQPLDIEDAIALLDSAPDDPRIRAMLKVEVMRAHMLRLEFRPWSEDGDRVIRELADEAGELFGDDAPITELVEAGRIVATGRCIDVERRLDRWARDHGPDDTAGLELEAWAAMTHRNWERARRRRTIVRLSESPEFGPDHLYTLLLVGDLQALSGRFEQLPRTIRHLVSRAVGMRARMGASLVAEGRFDEGLYEYAVLARELTQEGRGHTEEAWSARVEGLKIPCENEHLRRDVHELLAAGTEALGADHPLIVEAAALAGDPPSARRLPRPATDVPSALLGHGAGADLESWHAYLSLWISHLGDPDFVCGPVPRFRWYLDEGAVDVDVLPRGDGSWAWDAVLYDAESLAEYDNLVGYAGKWGEMDDENVHLWWVIPPDNLVPEGTYLLGEYCAEKPADEWRILSRTLGTMGEDLQLLPRSWAQSAVVEWATPGSVPRRARMEITADRVVVVVDHQTVSSGPSTRAGVEAAIRTFIAAFDGRRKYGITKDGWFTYRALSSISPG